MPHPKCAGGCLSFAATIVLFASSPLTAADLSFRLHPINADSTFEACSVMDVNRDGKLDVVSGGFWYEAPTWKKHFVREVEKLGNPPNWDGYSHLEIDVNNDGWTDLINVNWRWRSISGSSIPAPHSASGKSIPSRNRAQWRRAGSSTSTATGDSTCCHAAELSPRGGNSCRRAESGAQIDTS